MRAWPPSSDPSLCFSFRNLHNSHTPIFTSSSLFCQLSDSESGLIHSSTHTEHHSVRHSRQQQGWYECEHTRSLQDVGREVDRNVKEFLITACSTRQMPRLDVLLTHSQSGAPTKIRLLPLAMIFIMIGKAAIGSHSTVEAVSIKPIRASCETYPFL